MGARPEPMLLENGDLLVPTEDGTEMVKLRPGDEGHAAWIAHIQEKGRQRPSNREARTPSAGRTAARFGLGFIVFIAIVAVLLVVATLVILNLVSDVSLPDLPGLPKDTPTTPENAPGGFIGPIGRF